METKTTLFYGLEEYQFTHGCQLTSIFPFFFFPPKFLQFLLFILPPPFKIHFTYPQTCVRIKFEKKKTINSLKP